MFDLNKFNNLENKINKRLGFTLQSIPYNPTLFTLTNGTDAVVDEIWSYQIVNKFKNHWYSASAPSDPKAGMIWIDSDNNVAYRYDGAAWVAIILAGDSPTFVTAKLSGLTDGYIPYHVSDAVGLANSGLYWDGAQLGIGMVPNTKVSVSDSSVDRVALQIHNTEIGHADDYLCLSMGGGTAFGLSDWVDAGVIEGTAPGGLYLGGYKGPVKIASGDSARTVRMTIATTGNVIIGSAGAGDLWIGNNCSALSFTDRTDFFEGDALAAILNIKGKDGKLDHATLPPFVQAPRKQNIEEEQTITKTRQKTVKIKKQVPVEEVKLVKGKYTKVMVVKEQEIDEPIFEEYDLYNEMGKKILDKYDNPVKHKVPVMEEYQVTEKVKIGEEDVVYRNLGNMVSMLTVAIQQLDARIKALEA